MGHLRKTQVSFSTRNVSHARTIHQSGTFPSFIGRAELRWSNTFPPVESTIWLVIIPTNCTQSHFRRDPHYRETVSPFSSFLMLFQLFLLLVVFYNTPYFNTYCILYQSSPNSIHMSLSKLMGCRFNPVVPRQERRGRKTLADVSNSKYAKRAKLIDERRSNMPAVEAICCCSNGCISHAIPNVEKRQQMRDEYFSYKSDCNCKQWLKA